MTAHPVPTAALKLTSQYRDLVIEQSRQGDLLVSQDWGAVFDPLKEYRYLLWRIWDASLPVLIVIMLNPSVADALQNDSTIRLLIERARRGHMGGVIVANAFAFRATDPRMMKSHPAPEAHMQGCNDFAIQALLEEPRSTLLCAWGDHIKHRSRKKELACLIYESRKTPHCIRLTVAGEPCHPLRTPYSLEPTPFQLEL